MINLESLLNAPWKEIISACSTKSKSMYWDAFSTAYKEPTYEPHKAALEIFRSITSPMLEFDDSTKKYKYHPVASMRDRRSFLPDDLSEEDADVLLEFLDTVNDIVFDAIISDILWESRGKEKYKYAARAIKNYLQYPAIEKIDSYEVSHCLGRAIDISLSLGSGGIELHKKCLDASIEYIRKLSPECISGYELHLFEMLSCLADAQADTVIQKCKEAVVLYQKQQHILLVTSLLESALRIASDKKIRDFDMESELKYQIGEANYIHSESRQDSALVRSIFIKQAIEAHRRYGNSKRADELHGILLATQAKIENELHSMKFEEIDITREIQKAEEHVSGKDVTSALFSLAFIDSPVDVDDLIPKAKKDADESAMLKIVSPLYINASGKTPPIPKSILDPGITPDVDYMLSNRISMNISITVDALIKPAIQRIQAEHRITVPIIGRFIYNNPFIPVGHEYYYARGLQAGFDMDFPLFCSLVVPQLENSFRYIILQNGGNPSTLDASGNQKERNIDSALEDPIILDAFGKTLVKLLQRLLTDPRLSNIRHSIAHGLLPYNYLYSSKIIYIWWITLRFILNPFLRKQK